MLVCLPFSCSRFTVQIRIGVRRITLGDYSILEVVCLDESMSVDLSQNLLISIGNLFSRLLCWRLRYIYQVWQSSLLFWYGYPGGVSSWQCEQVIWPWPWPWPWPCGDCECSWLLMSSGRLHYAHSVRSISGRELLFTPFYSLCEPRLTVDEFPFFLLMFQRCWDRGAFDSAKNRKRQRRKRQSVTVKREKSQTQKVV